MTYKDNTPNYNTKRNVVNFGDFCDNWDSEKEKLKKTNRSILKNSERQQNVKNVKSEFDTVTRKYTDLSKDEIEDKLNSMEGLDEAVAELTDANVTNLERFVDDYRKKHTKLETRGVQEGLSLLRRATSIEEAISLVNKRIDKYKSLKKTPVENKVDEKEIIKGLNDFLLQIEAK